jgi:hypothetical protein
VQMPLQFTFESTVRSDTVAARFQGILSVLHLGRYPVEAAAQTRRTLIDCLPADGPGE